MLDRLVSSHPSIISFHQICYFNLMREEKEPQVRLGCSTNKPLTMCVVAILNLPFLILMRLYHCSLRSRLRSLHPSTGSGARSLVGKADCFTATATETELIKFVLKWNDVVHFYSTWKMHKFKQPQLSIAINNCICSC